MTPSIKYRAILCDIERFLHDRAQRYFEARYAGEAEDLLKVQCDTIMVVLKTHLEPHVEWFEHHEGQNVDTLQSETVLLTVDLDPEVLKGIDDAS